jgi:UDP-N-acetyl-D-glucosamine/UDP-N-acetyl-D-galactosamine dehydrogenase
VNPDEARHEYAISPIPEPKPAHYDAIVIAVGHRQFADMGSTRIHALGKPTHVLYDVKHLLSAQDSDARI